MSRWPAAWSPDAPGATCPTCGAAAGRPIVRGLPGGEMLDAVWSREIDVVMGGCVIRENEPPTHRCRGCGTEFTPARKESR